MTRSTICTPPHTELRARVDDVKQSRDPAIVSSDGSTQLPHIDMGCERPRLVPTSHWCNWYNARVSDMHARRMVHTTQYSPVGVNEGGSEAATARATRHRYTADATTTSVLGALTQSLCMLYARVTNIPN